MSNGNRVIGACALVLIAALLVVGAVSGGVVHHIVQSAPAWIAAILAFRGSPLARWAALPVFLVWLLIFAMIWLFLLGYPSPIDGTFGRVEVAMTVVGGFACALGIAAALRGGGAVRWWVAILIFIVVAALQIGAVAAGLTPPLVSDKALLARLFSPG